MKGKNIMVYFAGSRCSAKAGKYENGQVSIKLFDYRRRYCAVATIALDAAGLRDTFELSKIPEGWVIIKDYHENKGIFDAFVKAQIVTEEGAEYANLYSYRIKVVLCKLITELP